MDRHSEIRGAVEGVFSMKRYINGVVSSSEIDGEDEVLEGLAVGV